MDESTNVLSWPTSPGHVTVRPLSAKSPCKVWLIRRERDQSYMVLKLSLTMENATSLRQSSVTQSGKYVVDFYGTLPTQLGDGLIMEYCPGGSVGDLVLSRGVFSLGESITALAPIAQALSVMHAQGLRHGDLSPANILLTASGMPKIIDFQESAPEIQYVSGAGTPGFMAPEIVAGGKELQTGEQDVYSLGACLWFLLSGKPPDRESIRPPARVIFPQIPSIIHELLIDSLSSDPRERPTAEQFARTLFSSDVAEPIRWEGHVSEEATHLMETIHPGTETGNRKQRGFRKGSADKLHATARDAGSRSSHRLRRTPGAMKLVAAVIIGIAVLAGSLIGVNHLRAAMASDSGSGSAQEAVQTTCRINDVGSEPACSMQQDTIVSAFLSLTKKRDVAMSKMATKDLEEIYVSGSEQLKRDLETISTLRELKLSFVGLSTVMRDVSVSARGQGNSVILAATSSQGEYKYVDAQGKIVHAVRASDAQHIEIELVLVDGAWRIGKVLRH